MYNYMDAKRKSGMSWADLEEATGVPASTLRDHMGGGVKSPDQDILDAARSAMDPQGAPQGPQGSHGISQALQDIPQASQDIPQASQDTPQASQDTPQASQDTPQGVEMVPASTLAVARELYERQLAQLERALLKSERRTKRLAIALAVCVIFFTLLMAFDILNRDAGWFRDALGFGPDAAHPAVWLIGGGL